MLRLHEKIACWRCTRIEGRPLRYRVMLGDWSGRIERLRQRLSGVPARVKPRPGRTIDRRWRTEQALRRALIVERSGMKGARDALAKERPAIPESCANLDLDGVGLEFIRASGNVRTMSKALKVPVRDLRLLGYGHRASGRGAGG